MTSTIRGCVPIVYNISDDWECCSLLLTNDKYGLVVTYKRYRKPYSSLKHKVIKNEEFTTPDEAYQYALDWVETNGENRIRELRKLGAPDDLD